MIIPADRLFREQRERYQLRFNCEECVYYDPRNASCIHGYPTYRHRAARYVDPEADIYFCKDFDVV